MEIPTEQYCFDLYKKYVVPPNIKNHCLSVRRLAVFLAEKLLESGITLDVEVVDRLALMHDAFKIVAIKNPTPSLLHPRAFTKEELTVREELREKYPGKFEGEVAYEILKDEFPTFAELLLHATNPRNTSRGWEDTILHYSDYRTFKHKIVSLDERFDYFKKMYPNVGDWNKYLIYMKVEEERIFSKLSFTPLDLKSKLDSEPKLKLFEE